MVYLLWLFSSIIWLRAESASLALAAARLQILESLEDRLTDGYLIFQRDVAYREFLLYHVEPRVSLDLFYCEPRVDASDEDSSQEVLGFWAHETRDLIVAGEDLLVEQALAVLVEREVATQHRVKSNPRTPNIDCYRIVEFPVDYLIMRCLPPEPRSTENRRKSSVSLPRSTSCPVQSLSTSSSSLRQ